MLGNALEEIGKNINKIKNQNNEEIFMSDQKNTENKKNQTKEKAEVDCSAVFMYNPEKEEYFVVTTINGTHETISSTNLEEIFEFMLKLVEEKFKSPESIMRARINRTTTQPQTQPPKEKIKQTKKEEENENKPKIQSLF